METVLIVVRPFGRHARGDAIADAGEIATVLAGEHARSVVSVLVNTHPCSATKET